MTSVIIAGGQWEFINKDVFLEFDFEFRVVLIVIDFEDFEFLVKPASEKDTAVPIRAREDGFMFFGGSTHMSDGGIFISLLALEGVVFFLVEVVFNIELLLSVSDLGPVFESVLFFVESFKFSFVLFLVGIF